MRVCHLPQPYGGGPGHCRHGDAVGGPLHGGLHGHGAGRQGGEGQGRFAGLSSQGGPHAFARPSHHRGAHGGHHRGLPEGRAGGAGLRTACRRGHFPLCPGAAGISLHPPLPHGRDAGRPLPQAGDGHDPVLCRDHRGHHAAGGGRKRLRHQTHRAPICRVRG